MLTPSSVGSRGDLGQHTGPVGHRHAQLHELGVDGRPDGEVARAPRALVRADRAGRHGRRRRRAPRTSCSAREVVVEAGDDRVAVGDADVGPDRGVTGGDAGHVSEPTGGEPQQRRVLLVPARGDIHQRGCRELRNVAHDGDERIVVIGAHREHLGPEAGREVAHGPIGGGVGARSRREHPGGALEHVGVGAVGSVLLGARHRVAADEPRRRRRVAPPRPPRRPRPSPSRRR